MSEIRKTLMLQRIKAARIALEDGYKNGVTVSLDQIEADLDDEYPDTEADGIVFCGKCGKRK